MEYRDGDEAKVFDVKNDVIRTYFRDFDALNAESADVGCRKLNEPFFNPIKLVCCRFSTHTVFVIEYRNGNETKIFEKKKIKEDTDLFSRL